MTEREKDHHHPLPADDRARHDLIPEGVEESRDRGEDSPGEEPASETEPPAREYANPDGSKYPG